MSAVPQKIRTGLLELRTHLGPVYVSPSFWERIYLLWTFRNFPSLPRQVLNQHQQQLIDKLCRAAIVSRKEPVARASIIGAVENVCLMPDCETKPAATTGKLIEMRATRADIVVALAVGSGAISIRSSRAAYNQNDAGPFNQRSGNLQQYVSAPEQDSVERGETEEVSLAPSDSDANRTRSLSRVGGELLAVCGAALLGIFIYFRESRPALSPTVPQVSIRAQEPAAASVRSAAPAPLEKVQQFVSAERRQPATISAVKSSPAVSSRQHETRHHESAILTQPSGLSLDSSPGERLQVSEVPKSGFVYPVAPNPALTGRVSLKAVIGTDGTVREVDVLSGNRALADAAVKAVRHWRYRSHELKGHAVEAETNVAISFVGEDVVSISFTAAH
jgi:TonB family protein